jgi:hypothetical protein
MKHSKFRSKIFYWLLIVFLSGLIICNLYNEIASINPMLILSTTIQVTLLILVLTKHKAAKIGLQIWSTLFLIIASVLQISGHVLKCIVDGFSNNDYLFLFNVGFLLLVGILILIFTNNTVDIETIDK